MTSASLCSVSSSPALASPLRVVSSAERSLQACVSRACCMAVLFRLRCSSANLSALSPRGYQLWLSALYSCMLCLSKTSLTVKDWLRFAQMCHCEQIKCKDDFLRVYRRHCIYSLSHRCDFLHRGSATAKHPAAKVVLSFGPSNQVFDTQKRICSRIIASANAQTFIACALIVDSLQACKNAL